MKKIFGWLGATGFLVLIVGIMYEWLTGDVDLSYSRSLPSGYEFILSNGTISDQVIDEFRVKPLTPQEVLYVFTKDVRLPIDDKGRIIPPEMFVPAAEFKELDGIEIAAKSELKFRIPPLIDKEYLQPQAALIQIEYSTSSSSRMIQRIERALRIRQNSTKAEYLVLNDYWTPVKSGTIRNAISQACREDPKLARADICQKGNVNAISGQE